MSALLSTRSGLARHSCAPYHLSNMDQRLLTPFVAHWNIIANAILGPLRPALISHPFILAPLGLQVIRSARAFAHDHFKGERARALFAGLSAHSMLPLEQPLTAGFGLMLQVAGHAIGWPMPRGGAQKIVDAMAAYLRSLGGEIVTGAKVTSLYTLPPARAVLCDLTPRQLLAIADHRLPSLYRRQLQHYRYGPGVFKIDYALDGPIPWKAIECARAGTVHIGGTLPEVASAERMVSLGQHPEKPFVLVAQHSLFDPTRAPSSKHTLWAYCHVPNGSTFDMAERIEAQIERFAPGFRDLVLARHTMNSLEIEQYNANYIGGDINGGVQDLWQFFTRPTPRLVPYSTPVKGLYICSSSTPPGGGVHGQCGYFAAQAALHAAF
jgi:phytoene dehydrogenase-like protein